MQGPNHSPRKEELNSLAQKISAKICACGVCQLKEAEISLIWCGRSDLTAIEKRFQVADFARQYGFLVVAEYDLYSAVFRK
jgi:hypothetical protein